VKKYFFIILLIGVWNCDERSENTIIGDWGYLYTEYNISEMLDNDLLNKLDSSKELSHQNRVGLIIRFSKDSVSIDRESFSYNSTNDSIFIIDYVNWEYELSGDELTIISQIIWTNENGDPLPTYNDLMTLERL
jgi:hypothetical protein